jgi:Domain of unknown function (DUF4286)
MILYNVTIKVDNSIVDEWLNWLSSEHIPEVIATGCFTGHTLCRLLETDEEEGPTFSVQYKANSRADYDRYIENFADTMRKKSFDKWGNKFIAFRSVMEVVN